MNTIVTTQHIFSALQNEDINELYYLLTEESFNPCILNSLDGKFTHTPLTEMCKKGNIEFVKMLLRGGSSINAKNDFGHTPLMTCCIEGHAHIVQLLLSLGADYSQVCSSKNTALMFASARGHFGCVIELLKYDNCEVINFQNNNEHTALMKASISGFHECVALLLEANANYNIVDKQKENSLILAAKKNYFKVCELILYFSRYNDYNCFDRRAFKKSVLNLHLETSFLFINNGANIDFPCEETLTTILMEICSTTGNSSQVKFICENLNCNVNQKDFQGNTAILFSVQNACTSFSNNFNNNNFNNNNFNNNNFNNNFEKDEKIENFEKVENSKIDDNNTKKNEKNEKKYNMNNCDYVKCIKILINHGANIYIKNFDNISAFDYISEFPFLQDIFINAKSY